MTDALQAVIFDLDGVLLDSERVWDDVRRGLVADLGGHWRADATRAMMGMSSREWSRYMRDQLGVPLAPEEISDQVVARLLARYRRELPLLPGAIAAVQRMAGRWPLALASSSNRELIDTVLATAGVAGMFSATVSSEEVAHGKPAPDVYLAAADKLGVDPRRAAAVEDSSNGLRAAAAAGALVVAVPNPDFPPTGDALSLARLVLHSLDELTEDALQSASRRASA